MLLRLFKRLFKKPCRIDWDLSREEWIESVLTYLVPKLEQDQRFDRSADLIGRFHWQIKTWRENHKFQPVIEIANELAAAECLLDRLSPGEKLIYEPPMKGTDKRIDFLILDADGSHSWVEVKTVSPQWNDTEAGWQRFLGFSEEFPETAKLIVDREWSGAAVAGQAFNARMTFIQKTMEVEQRARCIPAKLNGPVWILFCSTGSNWYIDELEDFADFYKTSHFRADDWAQNITARYMQDRNIVFERLLQGFHYLERKHSDVSAVNFVENVKAPDFGS